MKNMFSNIRGDVFGGITAGIVALPLALAFGVSSGLGPSAGLYGAIFLGFFAALFGGTNTQISGPTAPLTAVSMVVVFGVVALNDGDLAKALPIIFSVFLLAGIMQIALGFLGVGKYIKYIPYPVVSGFMTAIGVIILVTQLLPVMGYYPKEDVNYVNEFNPQSREVILKKILEEQAGDEFLTIEHFKETVIQKEKITQEDVLKESKILVGKESSGVWGTLKVLPRAITQIKWLEFILALATIFIIYGFKRITKTIPSTLVGLLVVSGIAYGFQLNYRPIEEIPGGFPVIHWEIFTNFKLNQFATYAFSAFTLAILGSIDSLLTSIVADNLTKTKHRPNKELIGQGIGNGVAALFGGIPGAGATIRTVVNIKSGGKSKLSGMVAGIVLLIVLLLLGPAASKIPAAVLAGILITVGLDVVDYKGLKSIKKIPFQEVLVMLVVLILSAFWDLVYAVGIGLILSSLMFMKKMGDLTAKQSEVTLLSKEKAWEDEADFPENLKGKAFIKHINGPLFFGSTSDFQQQSKLIPVNASIIVVRTSRMDYIDQSGLYVLEEVLIDLKRAGKTVLLVGLKDQPYHMLKLIGIVGGLIPKEHIFKNFKECVPWIKKNVENITNQSI